MTLRIIVPIYNGVESLTACIGSLTRNAVADVEVELVDDASPDPRVAALLKVVEAAQRPGWTVRRQPQNLGFIGTVNAAMRRAAGDVVLLNADTVVTVGWIDRIRACADSDPRIASITPFSNNAEICSWPQLCRAAPVPAAPDAIARACLAAGAPTYPDLPTGVGFCMFLRRAALDAIGDFDQATFGRGYGEENDWCMRAAAHGWRNVLCDDAYVVHVGGQSFADLGLRPGGENLRHLLVRYPGYNAQVAEFILRDPLRARRAAIADRLPAMEPVA